MSMGTKRLESLERELGRTWTENLSINTDHTNPFMREARSMTADRSLSVSLRKQLRLN